MLVKEDYSQIGEYISRIYPKDVDFVNLGRETRLSYIYIIKIFKGEVCPAYSILEELVKKAGKTPEDIKEEANSNSIILFKYWGNLYPNAQPLKNLNIILRNEINERNINRKELSLKTGIHLNNIYAMEVGTSSISYTKFKKICDYMKVDPCDIIKKLLDDVYKEKNLYLSKVLIAKRKEKGWTSEKASEFLGIPYKKYLNLEQGAGRLANKYIMRIVSEYNLNYEDFVKNLYENNLLRSPLPNLSDYKLNNINNQKSSKFTISEIKEGRLDVFLEYLMLSYEKIRANQEKLRASTYKTNTVLTTLYLILTNQTNTKEVHKSEIIYYLKNIKNSELVCDGLIKESGLSLKDNSIEEIFDYYKDYYLYSYTELEILTSYSRSAINQLYRSGEFKSPNVVDKLYGLLGIPSSVGYEYIFRKRKADIKRKNQGYLRLEQLIEELTGRQEWNFYGEIIKGDYLGKLFKVILNDGIKPAEKYLEIERINS